MMSDDIGNNEVSEEAQFGNQNNPRSCPSEMGSVRFEF